MFVGRRAAKWLISKGLVPKRTLNIEKTCIFKVTAMRSEKLKEDCHDAVEAMTMDHRLNRSPSRNAEGSCNNFGCEIFKVEIQILHNSEIWFL